MTKMLHSGFLRNAALRPSKIALVDRDERLTYREVLERALRVAAVVQKTVPGSVRPVAIAGDKSAQAAIAILGVLLSGRAYSYLLPSQKAPRLVNMIEQLQPALLLDVGTSDLSHAAEAYSGTTPVIRLSDAHLPEGSDPVATPEGCAYVLFTSGSTGTPKGIMFGHQAAYAAQRSFISDVELKEDDIVGNEVNLAFDVSVLDLGATWAVGGTVDLLPDSCSTNQSQHSSTSHRKASRRSLPSRPMRVHYLKRSLTPMRR